MIAGTAVGLLAGAGIAQLGAGGGAEALAATFPTPDWLNVLDYGADPNGTADSTTAIQTAINDTPISATNAARRPVYVPAGTYLVSSTVNLPASVYLVCEHGTTFNYTGTGACISMTQTSYQHSGPLIGGGILGRPTIDGAQSAAPAYGFQVGDIPQLEIEAFVQNFTGTGSIGAYFCNRNFWAEQARTWLFVKNCASHAVFDCVPANNVNASGSFERGRFVIYIEQDNPPFDGVVFRNGAFIANGELSIYGNFSWSSTAVSSAVLRLTGSTPAGQTNPSNSGMVNSVLNVGVECSWNETGTSYTPQTIVFGSSANTIVSCSGRMDFGVTNYYHFSASNDAGNVTGYQGPIFGDSTLPGAWLAQSSGFPAGWTGDVNYRILPTGGGEVMVWWAMTIASGTNVPSGETIISLPSGYYYSDNKMLPGNLYGGGLSNQYAPAVISPTGSFKYDGPDFTASGTAWWYGQAVFTVMHSLSRISVRRDKPNEAYPGDRFVISLLFILAGPEPGQRPRCPFCRDNEVPSMAGPDRFRR